MHKFTQILAGLILGLIIPVYLLINVSHSISKLNEEINMKEGLNEVIINFKKIKVDLKTPDDYALISMLAAENANQKTMINKQIMKVAVIQIGFSVISIGLFFIVLGFNDGGVDANAGNGEFTFNVKTGSTGLVAIIIGASMATMGGIMKNEYRTVQVPIYGGNLSVENENLSRCEELFKSLKEVEKRKHITKCMEASTFSQKKY